ncbi:MAG: HD-GYP domain-containing protein [Firmicutes bacterium]|nr:HD-GYP domain-containing protein [Bacillota bacterium]
MEVEKSGFLSEYSAASRFYILIVAIGGAITAYYSVLDFKGVFWFELVVWLGFFILSECWPVTLITEDQITISFVLHISAVVIIGVPAAVLLAGISSLLVELFSRKPIVKTVFNCSQYMISVFATGFVYYQLLGLGPDVYFNMHLDLLAFAASAAAYFIVNTFMVTIVVSLTQRLHILDVIAEDLPMIVFYFGATVCLGVPLVLIYRMSPPATILLTLPLVLAHYSFRQYLLIRIESRETIELLADMIDQRDTYTARHSSRVAHYALEVSKRMHLTVKEMNDIYYAARVHDLGKIGIPDAVLQKPDRLTQQELSVMQRHAELGYNVLSRIRLYARSARYVYSHHERPDGCGYPRGLRESEIPKGSQIIAVCDAYDAMTSDRPYRKALSREKAIAELQKHSNTQFFQEVVTVLLEVLRDEKSPETSSWPEYYQYD